MHIVVELVRALQTLIYFEDIINILLSQIRPLPDTILQE